MMTCLVSCVIVFTLLSCGINNVYLGLSLITPASMLVVTDPPKIDIAVGIADATTLDVAAMLALTDAVLLAPAVMFVDAAMFAWTTPACISSGSQLTDA